MQIVMQSRHVEAVVRPFALRMHDDPRAFQEVCGNLLPQTHEEAGRKASKETEPPFCGCVALASHNVPSSSKKMPRPQTWTRRGTPAGQISAWSLSRSSGVLLYFPKREELLFLEGRVLG